MIGTAVLFAGCASQPLPGRAKQIAAVVPMRVTPLQALIPAAGLEWMIVADLQEIRSSPVLEKSISQFFPEFRLQAFEHVTAIDLRRVRHAVVASYEGAMLYVVDGVRDPLEAERRFRARLMSEIVRSVHRDDAIVVTGKSGAKVKRAIAALLPEVVVVESGDDRRAKASLLYALGRLRRSPRALETPDLSMLAARLGRAPVLAFAPGPFEAEWARGVRGLLGASTAAGASVRVTPIGTLQASFALAGAWGEQAEAAAKRLAESWGDIAESSFGRLAGLNQPVRDPLSTHAEEAVSLTVEVDTDRFLAGLRAAVSAQVSEIMREETPQRR